MSKIFAKYSYRDLPLFQDLSAKMIEEIEEAGLAEFDRAQDPEEQLWQWLREYSQKGASGRKVSMTRYGASVHAGHKNRGLWTVRRFQRCILAMEADFLKGRKFIEKMVSKRPIDDEGEPTTNPGRPTLLDRSMRAVCQNACVVGLLVLEDAWCQTCVATVVAVAGPLDKYHTEHARTLNNVDDTSKWLQQQINGGLQEHMNDFVKLLTDSDALASASFQISASAANRILNDPDAEQRDLEIMLADEHAKLFGQLVCGMVATLVARATALCVL